MVPTQQVSKEIKISLLKLLKCESYLINGTELKDWGRSIAVSGHGHFGPGQARAALTDGGAAVPAGVGVGRNRSYFSLNFNFNFICIFKVC